MTFLNVHVYLKLCVYVWIFGCVHIYIISKFYVLLFLTNILFYMYFIKLSLTFENVAWATERQVMNKICLRMLFIFAIIAIFLSRLRFPRGQSTYNVIYIQFCWTIYYSSYKAFEWIKLSTHYSGSQIGRSELSRYTK